MMITGDQLFIPTETRCKCGMSFLEQYRSLLTCPSCGYYLIANPPPISKNENEVYLDEQTGKFTFNKPI